MRNTRVSSTLLKACKVLHSFGPGGPPLTLKQIVTETALPTTTTHRILSSLVEGGILELRSEVGYVRREYGSGQGQLRYGYAAQTNENSFSRLVTESIRSSAVTNGVELVLADNHYSPLSALRNAEHFVREKVHLAIEFQSYESIASKVTAQLSEANIPVIAIEIPHPGAIYFGANNFRAGYLGGMALAKACRNTWAGCFDEVLLLKQSAAGQVPHARLDGTIAALRKALPSFSEEKLRILEGNGRYEKSLEVTRRLLRRSRAKHLLISGINDLSCLGALQALRECGREENALIVGQNGVVECRSELRKPNSALIGTVAYFPERYGEKVMQLAHQILHGINPPSATFTEHVLLTSKNVNEHYPYDVQAQGKLTRSESLLRSLR